MNDAAKAQGQLLRKAINDGRLQETKSKDIIVTNKSSRSEADAAAVDGMEVRAITREQTG